jgi:hypothetical protein
LYIFRKVAGATLGRNFDCDPRIPRDQLSGFLFSYFNCLPNRLIDFCAERPGYRHTPTMQWGGEVVPFKSILVDARHLASHVTVNQLILDGPHSVEFAPVDQKFLFKSGLVRLRQLAEQVSPDQIFARINFHDANLWMGRKLSSLIQYLHMEKSFSTYIYPETCKNVSMEFLAQGILWESPSDGAELK